jgi:diaminohydroxyphosphoribosylaminopyrimidine deaminase / 5-amino-6-(5-phosphoribosylamino)uracil reductase
MHAREVMQRALACARSLEGRTRLVKPFATHVTRGRSYIIAKWAMTLDGKMATVTGGARWTCRPDARTWAHDLRHRIDAIVIGAGTVRSNNLRLTVGLSSLDREIIYREVQKEKSNGQRN